MIFWNSFLAGFQDSFFPKVMAGADDGRRSPSAAGELEDSEIRALLHRRQRISTPLPCFPGHQKLQHQRLHGAAAVRHWLPTDSLAPTEGLGRIRDWTLRGMDLRKPLHGRRRD